MTQELIMCPLCAKVVYSHVRARVSTRISIPSRASAPAQSEVLTELHRRAVEEQQAEKQAAEDACVAHYVEHHGLRYRLWKRLRWTWLMRWPQRKPPLPLPDQRYYELTF